MKNLVNLLIVPAFLFCSFQKESGLASVRSVTVENTVEKSDRIMYLFFKADKDRSGNERITLQETKISEGRLKITPSFDRNEVQTGDFIITLMGADGKEAAQQRVKDPLNPELEVYEKEGLSRHRAPLQNAEFSVRFPYAENIQLVKIEKATDSGLQLLFTQKL
ncbi:MAG: hypothetical protein MUW56_08025 [Chryseobacterium sp.]|uniref:hypothetical protein n=1 Tax=Chryseobacterium sp. TaxID=1871047 RepID=UPI0025C6C922|nr:hypothetical protein [Chryseobacterium sp.]MCJ7933574.1 hypothetical protein [Chryseobacterium sp.]